MIELLAGEGVLYEYLGTLLIANSVLQMGLFGSKKDISFEGWPKFRRKKQRELCLADPTTLLASVWHKHSKIENPITMHCIRNHLKRKPDLGL